MDLDEHLYLTKDAYIPANIIKVLPNFQLDALRFLWRHFKAKKACIYNDGPQMGKRIVVSVLLATLLNDNHDLDCRRVAVLCESKADIFSWIFKLKLFSFNGSYFIHHSDQNSSVIDDVGTIQTSGCRLIFIRWSDRFADESLQEIIAKTGIDYVIVDTRGRLMEIKLLDIVSNLVIITSADIRNCKSLFESLAKNMLKPSEVLGEDQLRTFYYARPSVVLRRTAEEMINQFPWINGGLIESFCSNWQKGANSMSQCEESEHNDLFSTLFELIFDVTVKDPTMSSISEEASIRTVIEMGHDEDQGHLTEPLRLLLDTETTFNGTLHLEESPDLFESMMKEDKEQRAESSQSSIKTIESVVHSSTPVESSANSSNNCIPIAIPNMKGSASVNTSEIFEITSNNAFANKIMITRDQSFVEVQNDCTKLTPKRHSITSTSDHPNETTPTSSPWLSKKQRSHKITPEKVLAKKRRSLIKFYSSGNSHNHASETEDWPEPIESSQHRNN